MATNAPFLVAVWHPVHIVFESELLGPKLEALPRADCSRPDICSQPAIVLKEDVPDDDDTITPREKVGETGRFSKRTRAEEFM